MADALLLTTCAAALEAMEECGYLAGDVEPAALVTAVGAVDRGGGVFHALNSQFRHKLTPAGRRTCRAVCQQGHDLFFTPPRRWHDAVCSLIGARCYLASRSWAVARSPLVSIASSNVGKGHRELPEWPRILEGILQQAKQRRWNLLLVEGTTFYTELHSASLLVDVPTTWLNLPLQQESLAGWLERCTAMLEERTSRFERDSPMDPLFVSPLVVGDALPAQSPLSGRDLLATTLADLVVAIHVRRGGRVEYALHQRLADQRFPPGSVWMRVPPADSRYPRGAAPIDAWLERGAVGWWLGRQETAAAWSAPELAACTTVARRLGEPVGSARRVRPQQVAARAPDACPESAGQPQWLVHCTRGTNGPKQSASLVTLSEAWNGTMPMAIDPLQNLALICRQGRLRANASLLRTSVACVCFSAVDLRELIARRRFRSHLGRWDWEPYGVLISRQQLERLGGRPVIYGDQDEFQRLPKMLRPFFQAVGKQGQWREEKEWRVCGDVDLQKLPWDSVHLFVHRKWEALRMARLSPWPVLWLED
ncbi:MAG: hypothetical protein KatS3mg111_0255 [Pirellulaceae bacterium]|nr:MAG: hypothetical protein KatS3mg111_0255 [Pirellulaceae bacterium]